MRRHKERLRALVDQFDRLRFRNGKCTQFAYRCDKQPAIGTLASEASSMLGRISRKHTTDNDPEICEFLVALVEDDAPHAPDEQQKSAEPLNPVVAVPEFANPGGCASNGLSERPVEAWKITFVFCAQLCNSR